MAKYIISKEALEKLRVCGDDAIFYKSVKEANERALIRVEKEFQVILGQELIRVGAKGRKLKNIDLTKGEVELSDIIEKVGN